MKLVAIILFSLFSAFTFAQNDSLSFIDPEVHPGFPGGMKAMNEFIKNNFKYPDKAKEAGIRGTCYLKFTVKEDGTIDNLTLLKGVNGCPECDDEAMRLFRIMPKWNPGEVDGKKVKMYFNIPVYFKIQ